MDIDEPLSILLNVESDKNGIKLRLDTNGLLSFDSTEKSVQTIDLITSQITIPIINDLQELLTEVFEYETFEQNNKIIFQFWGDYGGIQGEIECEGFTETFSDHKKSDLIQKGNALGKLSIDLDKRFLAKSAINTRLNEKLKFELRNQIERCERKAKFFEEKDMSKSEAFQSEIKFLHKMQRFLTGDIEF